MEMKQWRNTLDKFIKKFRYALIILLVGVVLMIWPKSVSDEEKKEEPVKESTASETSVEERLSEVLSFVDGAGQVQVMLTYSRGEQIIFQEDSNVTADSSSINTIIISDDDRSQSGLVTQVIPPVCMGAIVVCQGADDPAVKLAIVDAVSKVTGLGTNRISVMKMK